MAGTQQAPVEPTNQLMLRVAHTGGQLFGTGTLGRDGLSFHAQEKPTVSRKSCPKPGIIIPLAPGVRPLGAWRAPLFDFTGPGLQPAEEEESELFGGYFRNFTQSAGTTGGSKPELGVEFTFASL